MNSIWQGFVNWRTTITSILMATFVMLDALGVVSVDSTERATLIASAIIIFGWFTKDGSVDNGK